MALYFETVKSYADVPLTDQGVETSSFLEASDGLVKMFDLFGSTVFEFVKADLRGNIAGVRARFESVGSTANTLEHLVESERVDSQNHAAGCLVRLIRGLSLTCKALQHMQKDANAHLYTCFQFSYDQVLRHHHSWVINSLAYSIGASQFPIHFFHFIGTVPFHPDFPISRPSWPPSFISTDKHPTTMNRLFCALIQLAIRSAPHRRDFYNQLSQGGDIEKFDAELAKWLAGLDEIVEHMSKFLEQGGFGRV